MVKGGVGVQRGRALSSEASKLAENDVLLLYIRTVLPNESACRVAMLAESD